MFAGKNKYIKYKAKMLLRCSKANIRLQQQSKINTYVVQLQLIIIKRSEFIFSWHIKHFFNRKIV